MQLPAGRYYVGDPSYLLEDNVEAGRDALSKHEGAWCWRTAYGDGLYALVVDGQRQPERIAVDSGKLCLVPVEAGDRASMMHTFGKERMLRLVAEIQLDAPCAARVQGGDLEIGRYLVHTSDKSTPTYQAWLLQARDDSDLEVDATIPFSMALLLD